jgi:Fe-S-cluster-containing dehydrogenase component
LHEDIDIVWIRPENSLCLGCLDCRLACARAHYSSPDPSRAALAIRSDPGQNGKFQVIVCNQCGLCEVVCPVGAILRVENGIYRVFPECTGCLYCFDVCPQHAIFVHPEVPAVIKCDACGACVEACPAHALILER